MLEERFAASLDARDQRIRSRQLTAHPHHFDLPGKGAQTHRIPFVFPVSPSGFLPCRYCRCLPETPDPFLRPWPAQAFRSTGTVASASHTAQAGTRPRINGLARTGRYGGLSARQRGELFTRARQPFGRGYAAQVLKREGFHAVRFTNITYAAAIEGTFYACFKVIPTKVWLCFMSSCRDCR